MFAHVVSLFSIFWGTSILFFIVVVPVYIPTISEWGFLSSTRSPIFVITCLVDNSHSNRCKVVSHCSLFFFVSKEIFIRGLLVPRLWKCYRYPLIFSFSFVFFYFLTFFYCCSSTVAYISLPPLSPQPSPLPTFDPTLLWFCPCVLYRCSWKPFLLLPPLSPPNFPLVTVSLFFISMSLVIFCLLICFVD